tara:strand:+ start:1439 stop:2242 length:804 start_codon:yes stop_codon:yes gene_type:complete
MPSLRQLVRGLELLFWALPITLLVCVQEILAPAWESWGIMPLILSTGTLWFGVSRLRQFHPKEQIWQSAVRLTEVLALLMAGLVPFLHWIQALPELSASGYSAGQKHIIYSTIIFCTASIMFVLNLNHLLTRLGAILPDPVLRADIKLFVMMNFILFFPMLAAMWCCRLSNELYSVLYYKAPGLAESFGNAVGLQELLQGVVLWIAILIIATTMTMIWKAKEAVLNGVFSLQPALPSEDEDEETRIVPVVVTDAEGAAEKPVDPSLN